MNPTAPKRRHELDWLRIIATLVVFFYHSSRFFNLGDWHIKNAGTYAWVEVWNIFVLLWMMPLFFMISGAGLWFASGKSRGWRWFYTSKFSRLMIPVMVASVTHAALQIYLERLSRGQFSGSFFSFLPDYFSGLYLEIGSAGNFAFHGMHLWYLLFLFLYSLLCYRPFRWLAGGSRSGVLERITGWAGRPGLIYLLFPLPMVAMKLVIPEAALSPGNGGWGFLYYLWFLVAGGLLVSRDSLLNRIRKSRGLSLLLAALSTGIYLSQAVPLPPLMHACLRFFTTWCWLFAILGYGMRYLAFDHPRLKALNEGVLPFYILHQTVLLAVGCFTMALPLHDGLKWALVSGISLAVIMGVYLFLIRRSDLLRFLFGMKATRESLPKPWGQHLLILGYIGLILFSALNPEAGNRMNRSPAPMRLDAQNDRVLDSRNITSKAGTGIRLVRDDTASTGRAMFLLAGASPQVLAAPRSYVDLSFTAPAGSYLVWLRGKCATDNIQSDSVWLQTDKEIGTPKGKMAGNWLDVHEPGNWAWAGNGSRPVRILLSRGGEHRIRIHPRQTPHRIDQIWLSRTQNRLPAGSGPARIKEGL